MRSTVVLKTAHLVVFSALLALLIVASTTTPTSAKETQIAKQATTVNSLTVTTLVSHTKTAPAAKAIDTKPQYWYCKWEWIPGYYSQGYWVPGYYHQGYWVPGYYYYHCANWPY